MVLTKDKSFYKRLCLLAIPIALQNLISFSVTFADNVMISSLGDSAVSGVYIANQIQVLLQLISGGIEGAVLVLGAQYRGKGDTASVRKIAAIGAVISVCIGILLTTVCIFSPRKILSLFTNKSRIIDTGSAYLPILALSFPFFSLSTALIASQKSIEHTKVGMFISAISLTVNVGLNYLLIFGGLGISALGVMGAAYATLISRILECLSVLAYTFFIDKRLKLTLKDFFKIDLSLLTDFVKYGTPILLSQLVWAVNTLTSSAIMGRISGSEVVAALSVANTLYTLAYVASGAMSGALGIITARTVGAEKKSVIKEYSFTSELIFLSLGVLTFIGLQLIKNPFISFYGISKAAQGQARALINVVSVATIGTCYHSACLSGLVRSGGDVTFPFLLDFILVFIIVIPSALFAQALGAAPWVVFACLKVDQVLKCFVAAVKVNRFRWVKNLTLPGGTTH